MGVRGQAIRGISGEISGEFSLLDSYITSFLSVLSPLTDNLLNLLVCVCIHFFSI